MKEWIETFVETEHFPFYEFMWLCMLGLWWSVITRLRRIERIQNKWAKEIINNKKP